ncbi:hypothetical protein EYC80_004361 [Monilinia laxa]|uniref:Uncharacterized protein n=1 Tax=Monilinia laxa TaxID=61186 RepID=A0A5N6KMJ8_MONLA|nr:hypothetical protein EYC80_004361 [Monilinia laxa]
MRCRAQSKKFAVLAATSQALAFTFVQDSRDGRETTRRLEAIDFVENSVYLVQGGKVVQLTLIVPFDLKRSRSSTNMRKNACMTMLFNAPVQSRHIPLHTHTHTHTHTHSTLHGVYKERKKSLERFFVVSPNKRMGLPEFLRNFGWK